MQLLSDQDERIEQPLGLCQVLGQDGDAARVDVSVQRVVEQRDRSLAVFVDDASDFGRKGQGRDAFGGEPLRLARDRPRAFSRSLLPKA